MASESIITDEMGALIGVETPPIMIEVEKGDLRRFTEATGETDPRFADVFPPTFFCPDPIIAAQRAGLKRPWPFRYSIDGGSEWEFHRPVRVGDTLTLTVKIADLYEKRGSAKTGRMLFSIIEVRCTNQRNELVGIARGTGIVYEGARGENQEPRT